MDDDRLDALRYRWLRSNLRETMLFARPPPGVLVRITSQPGRVGDEPQTWDYTKPVELDRAIDAAMTTKPSGGGAAQEGE